MPKVPVLSLKFVQLLSTCLITAMLATLVLACRFVGAQEQATPQPAPTRTPTPAPLRVNSLDTLDSYTARFELDFAGRLDGRLTAGSISSTVSVQRDPPAHYQILEVDLTTPNSRLIAGEAEFIQVGGQTYVKQPGQEAWISFSNDAVQPADLGMLQLDALVMVPEQISTMPAEVITYTVSGRPREIAVYRFTAGDMYDPNLIFEEASIGVWLTVPDNYMVHYAMSATVRAVIPNPNIHLFDEGQYAISRSLHSINEPLTITPPAEALTVTSVLTTVPRLPDARLMTIFPTLIEYTSAISALSATVFYRDALLEQGWAAEPTSTIFDDKATLDFTKADQSLTIIITPAISDTIKVLLSLEGL